jgi:hypothetical protein
VHARSPPIAQLRADDETNPASTIGADMPVFGVRAGHYLHAADGYLSELVDLVDVFLINA